MRAKLKSSTLFSKRDGETDSIALSALEDICITIDSDSAHFTEKNKTIQGDRKYE